MNTEILTETRIQHNNEPLQACFILPIFIIILFGFIWNIKSTDTNKLIINAEKLLMDQLLQKCMYSYHFLIFSAVT